MIRRIIKILVMGLLFMGLLSLGGYTLNSFKSEVHLRDPQEVMSPLVNTLPDLPKGSEIVGQLPTYETEDGGLVGGDNNNTPTDGQVADSGDGGNKVDLPDFRTIPIWPASASCRNPRRRWRTACVQYMPHSQLKR